ncbi:hypothetical protein [Trichloromonas sp.]|uniref:hypothetical protein n=1 Tax=Trichloromonas sp. TaxID=3069249 RepID=UPI003D81C4CA
MMEHKEITVVFYGRRFPRKDWQANIDDEAVQAFLAQTAKEMTGFGVTLQHAVEEDVVIDINGYGDILNAIRLRSPKDGIGNLCLGHIIGSSPRRDLIEDIKRGINRVAFAPETIEPEDHNKKVCHNCGCGC